MSAKQMLICLAVFSVLQLTVNAFPDGGDSPPLPGPGLSYGGIPYGSVSGKVADYYHKSAPSSGRSANYAANSGVDYTPIEQWL